MKKFKSILSKTICSFFFILCITLILNAVSSRSEKAFKIIGFRSYVVLSGSMEPTFYPGDLVVTLHKDRTNLKVGDVATFVSDKEIVTHRVVEKTNEGYITKGDNNDVKDMDILTNDNLIGKQALIIPKGGHIVKFLSNTKVVAAEVMLAGALVILYNVRGNKDEEEAEYEKNTK
ncbi:signal peptidase I [Romboutsia maritimum]|uniref:Signal peptidase I n=1 Tax=Romboutsia maritimum TaxID=2020948 RepID=A0A371IS34_9FIRM|nr:signal peptidase I [Romboutsia maritimum]RDY23296.1 signal peptidase I [Romboutsia maritimum]